MIPGLSAGAGSSLSFQGGASSGGNQENYWGDNTGSQMIMGSNAKPQNYILFAIGGAAVLGAVLWAMKRK